MQACFPSCCPCPPPRHSVTCSSAASLWERTLLVSETQASPPALLGFTLSPTTQLRAHCGVTDTAVVLKDPEQVGLSGRCYKPSADRCLWEARVSAFRGSL